MNSLTAAFANIATRAPMRVRVSAVVLAAGLSARMGDQAKMLLDLAGKPMIRRTVENVLASEPAETIVVTGHRAEEIEAALSGLAVRCVRNPLYAEGQPTSVVAGVRALTQPCDAVMIVLGDQPLVTAADFHKLIDAYQTMERHSILSPHHQGKRGNPVVFAARHIPSIASGGFNVGCRRLIETHAEEVCCAELGSDVFTTDCDTPEDYRRLKERLEASA